MTPRDEREALMQKFNAVVARRGPIIGGGAGTGIIDGTLRQSLEETGINYSTGADMIRQAHELDLLTQSARLIGEWSEAARKVHKDVMVIAHGGPVSMPEGVAYILEHSTHCGGFCGVKGMPRAAQPWNARPSTREMVERSTLQIAPAACRPAGRPSR